MRFSFTRKMNYNKEYTDIKTDIARLLYGWKKVQTAKNTYSKKKLKEKFLKDLDSTSKKLTKVIEQFERNIKKLPYNESLQVNGINTNGKHFVPNVNNPPTVARMKNILSILSKTKKNRNTIAKFTAQVETQTNVNKNYPPNSSTSMNAPPNKKSANASTSTNAPKKNSNLNIRLTKQEQEFMNRLRQTEKKAQAAVNALEAKLSKKSNNEGVQQKLKAAEQALKNAHNKLANAEKKSLAELEAAKATGAKNLNAALAARNAEAKASVNKLTAELEAAKTAGKNTNDIRRKLKNAENRLAINQLALAAKNVELLEKNKKQLLENLNQAPPPNAPKNIPRESINKLVNVGLNISDLFTNEPKNAWKKYVIKYHPNKGGNTEVFKAIGEIYKRNKALIPQMEEYFNQKWAMRPKTQAPNAKGLEQEYKAKLAIASQINESVVKQIDSTLRATNIPTQQMYNTAIRGLNGILTSFKSKGNNLLSKGSCITMGDPAAVAALRNPTGNAELNNLRRRLANVCNGGGSRSTNSGTQTNVNQSVVEQVARQMSLYRNVMQKTYIQKEAAKQLWNIQEARFKENKNKLKSNHKAAMNNLRKLSAELENQIENLKKKPETSEFGTGTNNLQVLEKLKENVKELPANLQTRILALVPEGATNNQEARKVLVQVTELINLSKRAGLNPTNINFKNLQTPINRLKTGLAKLESVKDTIPVPANASLNNLRSGIQELTTNNRDHEVIFRPFKQELKTQANIKEKAESNQVAEAREKARVAFNQRVSRGSTGNNGSGTRSNKKGNQKKVKEEGNASTSSEPLNFGALTAKAAKNRANRNRIAREAKEKANRNEANRIAKEKAEANAARKTKLKKQLSNAWSKNLNTFGALKNPLFNDLQSYINGGSKLNNNVTSRYATNNNPAQHPLLLKKLNSFINSSSNNGLILGPVKKLQSQLKELVNAEAEKQLKIKEAAKRNENERLRAEEELAKEAQRAKANEARKAKEKAESNVAIAKKKKNYNNWFSELTPEEQNSLEKRENMNLNRAKQSLEVIRRKSKFNKHVNELVKKTKNHLISNIGVKSAKNLYNGIKSDQPSNDKIHDIFKKHVVSIYSKNRSVTSGPPKSPKSNIIGKSPRGVTRGGKPSSGVAPRNTMVRGEPVLSVEDNGVQEEKNKPNKPRMFGGVIKPSKDDRQEFIKRRQK